MKAEDIKIGHWYMIHRYGFENGIKGKAVEVCGSLVVLKFFWGGFGRTKQAVNLDRLVGECERPGWFSNH